MIILGIDPGYDRLGIAVIEKEDKKKEVLLHSECLQTSSKDDFYTRLGQVGAKVAAIIAEYSPEALALESLFITKNQKTAMHVSEARGVIAYEAVRAGIPIFEYTPPQIKIAVTGHGASDKTAVTKMIPLLIKLPAKKALDDEYDAIAVALTCLASEGRNYPQSGKFAKKIKILVQIANKIIQRKKRMKKSMPKTKPAAKSTEKAKAKVGEEKILKPIDGLEKIIEIDTEEKEIDLELVPGEVTEDDPEDEEGALDDEEVDPFKDKWEE